MTKQTLRLRMHSCWKSIERHSTCIRIRRSGWIASDIVVGVDVATEHRNSPKKPKQTNQTVATAVQTRATSPKQHAHAPLNKLRPGRSFSFRKLFALRRPGAIACAKLVTRWHSKPAMGVTQSAWAMTVLKLPNHDQLCHQKYLFCSAQTLLSAS